MDLENASFANPFWVSYPYKCQEMLCYDIKVISHQKYQKDFGVSKESTHRNRYRVVQPDIIIQTTGCSFSSRSFSNAYSTITGDGVPELIQ